MILITQTQWIYALVALITLIVSISLWLFVKHETNQLKYPGIKPERQHGEHLDVFL